MKREDLLRRIGNPDQLVSVRESVLTDGKARGSRIITVNNGKFTFVILADRGFDVAEMRYQGTNLSFISKNGIVSPAISHTDAVGFLSCFTGGFLYTCGLDNVGGPEGGAIQHGSMNMVPASRITVERSWEGDEYVVRISAFLENTALFGRNITLKRTYTVKYLSDEIELKDEIANNGFLDSSYMILYHCNFGYPMVDDGMRIEGDFSYSEPRGEDAKARMEDRLLFNAPVDDIPEFVYFHKVEGDTPCVKLVNERIGLVASVSYDKTNLPWLLEWKSLASGDYVLGIEPCSTTIDEKKQVKLAPGETKTNKIVFGVKRI